jgi:hypothetical protein
MSQSFASDYNDVNARLVEFREKHAEGSLQPADPSNPFDIRTIGDKTFIVYVAAAYRTPDDPKPGIGCAWEPFPGKTNFTRDSELQNAETSAWGRAIVAVLAADTKKGIASAEEVRNRQADQSPAAPTMDVSVLRARIAKAGQRVEMSRDDLEADFASRNAGQTIVTASPDLLKAYAEMLEKRQPVGV